jgi:nucleoside-diphosphate-sugar epimerase
MGSPGPTLVTGAYGLIGHEVVGELRAMGQGVVPTDRLERPPEDADFVAQPLVVEGVARLADFLREHRIGSIVHSAGISGPMLARDDPHLMFRVNAGGTLDLFEAARLVGVRRVVLISSASVYGRTGEAPVSESAPLLAGMPYGASKIASEAIAGAYCRAHGVGTVILRPCWVYGPRRRTDCVIRTMILDALAGRATVMRYGRDLRRQFVHVGDVAAAIVAALSESAPAGGTYNLADGARPTLGMLAELVRAIFPRARIEMVAGEDPDDDCLGPLDISAAARDLGWHPAIRLDEGILAYARRLA